MVFTEQSFEQTSKFPKNTGFKFGGGPPKESSHSPKKAVPGPGQYSVDKNSIEVKAKAPAYGFGTEKRTKDLTDSPLGPGSYELPSYTSDGKKYQMGLRKNMFELKPDKLPGPGAYQPDPIKSKTKAPEYRFGSEKRLKTAGKNSIPNPQSYNIKDNMMYSTASSWGMGYGQKIDLSKSMTETPGPGSYQYNSTITEGKKYGMRIRKDMFKLEEQKYAPGPGAYSPDEFKTKSKAPQFRFGTDSRLKEMNRTQVPNPQSYNVKDNIMSKTASAWGMGYGSKIDLAKTLADSPGPGSYEFKSSIADGK